MRKELFNMTQKEITKLRVINQTIDKVITVKEAAEILNLSERQIYRLKGGVQKEGPAFIIHKNRGRKPKHAISNKVKEEIINLKLSEIYELTNFNHFQELLKRKEKIQASYSAIHNILTTAGIKSPKKHRKTKVHHRRKRKPQKGMLVQIDASPHEWILGKKKMNLHGAIDDATGEILALFFTPNECLAGYFEIMNQIINNHGIPMSLYSDRHTIFISPKDGKLSVEEQLQGKTVKPTQFGRAMDELGVNIIKAYSPQAKGRIEKLWNTLQSRLIAELKIENITTIEEANAFLPQFIKRFNAKFGVIPENPKSAFRALQQNLNLDYILCIKEERTIIERTAFSYHSKYYQLIKNDGRVITLPKAKITVITSPQIGVKAIYAGEVYDTKIIEERPKKSTVKATQKQSKKKQYAPAVDHPWRQFKKNSTFIYDKTDPEVAKELFNSTRAWV